MKRLNKYLQHLLLHLGPLHRRLLGTLHQEQLREASLHRAVACHVAWLELAMKMP